MLVLAENLKTLLAQLAKPVDGRIIRGGIMEVDVSYKL